jgi:hypothetical protein
MNIVITDTLYDNTVSGTLTVYIVTGTMVDNTVTGTVTQG